MLAVDGDAGSGHPPGMAIRTGLSGSMLLAVMACHRPSTPDPMTAPAPRAPVPADPAPPAAPDDPPASEPPTAHASEDPEPPSRITGTWSGTYFYADDGTHPRPPVYFSAELALEGSTLRGHMIEPNTFADSPQAELHARVEGTVHEDGSLTFFKIYDGAAGISHTVTYEGHLDESRIRAEGRWNVRGTDGGPFIMSRQSGRGGLARAPIPPQLHQRMVR